MNNFQQMLKQAQLVQKKHENFKNQEFEFSSQKNLIHITISGSYKIKLNINFEKLLIEADNDYEMVNESVQIAINEAITKVKREENKILNV